MSVEIWVQPRVTLIGESEIHYPPHIDWQSDSENPADALAEFSGRLCFDQKTEVYTPDGWVRLAQLEEGVPVLTRNPETGYTEFQVPVAYHKYAYHGPMYVWDGRDISLAVTPEHRQYGYYKGHPDKEMFVKTSELETAQFAIFAHSNGWIGTTPDRIEIPGIEKTQVLANRYGANGTMTVSTKDRVFTGQQVISFAKLLTYFIAEGTKSKKGCVIYGHHVDSVLSLCEDLRLSAKVYLDPRSGVPRIHVGGGQALSQYISANCGSHSSTKKFPRWILDLPQAVLEEIWQILVATDGHITETGQHVYFTVSTKLSHQCQELLCKIGYRSSIRKNPGHRFPIYTVRRKLPIPVILNGKVKLQRVGYSDYVYCLTVSNGILFVRRDGKVHFSGNCYLSYGSDAGITGHKTIQGRSTNQQYLENILETGHGSVLEHNCFSVLLEGISRALTHELVRHRHFSFSQLSQRYVDESEVSFVMPPEIIDEGLNSELARSWVQTCLYSQSEYKALLARLLEKDTGESRTIALKRARQAARSVLPNATETKIVVSGNARAWRHFFKLRGNYHADREIRRLAVEIFNVLCNRAPNILQDSKIVEGHDGFPAIEIEYGSV